MNSLLLAISMSLTMNGNHEDSLKVLNVFWPTQNDNISMQFLKMTNYYALNNRSEATKYAQLIEDSFEEVPLRYSILAKMVLFNIENWSQDDLGDIGRDMRISKDRLRNAKGGKTTQVVQKTIVDKLDKLIKEKEDAANAANQSPDGDKVGQKEAVPGDKIDKPLEEAVIAISQGKGQADEKHFKTLAERWGNMPDKERARVIQILTKDYPVKYREVIEKFFKSIAEHK